MTQRNSIIDTTQKYSDVEDHVIVADGIGYGHLCTPITNMTRGRAKIRRSEWNTTPKVLITIKTSHIALHRRCILYV